MRSAAAILALGWAGFIGLLVTDRQDASPGATAEERALPTPPIIAMASPPPKPVPDKGKAREGKRYSDAPERSPTAPRLQGRYVQHRPFREWLLARGGAIYAIDEERVVTHQIGRSGNLQGLGKGFKQVSGAMRRIDLGDLDAFVQGEIPAHIRAGVLVWPRAVWDTMEQVLREIGASRSIEYEYEVSNADLKVTVKKIDGQSVTRAPFFVKPKQRQSL